MKGETWKQSSWIPEFMLSGQTIQKVSKTRFHLATTKTKNTTKTWFMTLKTIYIPPDQTRWQQPSIFSLSHGPWKWNCASLKAFSGSPQQQAPEEASCRWHVSSEIECVAYGNGTPSVIPIFHNNLPLLCKPDAIRERRQMASCYS